jgi:hypothetical protein
MWGTGQRGSHIVRDAGHTIWKRKDSGREVTHPESIRPVETGAFVPGEGAYSKRYLKEILTRAL